MELFDITKKPETQSVSGEDTVLVVKDGKLQRMSITILMQESNGNGGNADQSGLTATEKNLILTLFRNAAYISDGMGAVLTQLESLWSGGGEVEPDEPGTEKTLTSISAVYSGGDVAVGTAISELTGIVVTAHYSDGTSEAVTGYTLSGTIAEGSNTITVSYGGKTTTFTVTGTAESGGTVENLFKWTDQNYTNTNAVSLMVDSNAVAFACTQQTGYYAGIEVESGKTYTLFFDASNIYAGIRLYESASETIYPSSPGTSVATVYGKTENNCKTFTVNAEKPYIILGFMCSPTDGTTVSTWTNLALYEGTLTERP